MRPNNVFEYLLEHGDDEGFEPNIDSPEFSASVAMPGSDQKIEELRRRVELGLPLWHSDDRVTFDSMDLKALSEFNLPKRRSEEMLRREEVEVGAVLKSNRKSVKKKARATCRRSKTSTPAPSVPIKPTQSTSALKSTPQLTIQEDLTTVLSDCFGAKAPELAEACLWSGVRTVAQLKQSLQALVVCSIFTSEEGEQLKNNEKFAIAT